MRRRQQNRQNTDIHPRKEGTSSDLTGQRKTCALDRFFRATLNGEKNKA